MTLLSTNTFVAGDLWSWSITATDYPADLYTLKYIFRHSTNKASHLSVSSVPSASMPTDHDITVPGTNTAALIAGEYQVFVQAIDNATSEVQTVEQLTRVVQANPADFTKGSIWQEAIEALHASLIGDTSTAVLEYEVQGRKIKRMDVAQRREAIAYCQKQLRIEQGRRPSIKSVQYFCVR